MRTIAAAACVVSICSASSVFAMDLVTKAPQQEEISQNSPSLQSFPGTGQQSYVFGDWGGLRSWLSNHGIDLGLSYLSEPAWDVAGGMARGGTYAGQENLTPRPQLGKDCKYKWLLNAYRLRQPSGQQQR